MLQNLQGNQQTSLVTLVVLWHFTASVLVIPYFAPVLRYSINGMARPCLIPRRKSKITPSNVTGCIYFFMPEIKKLTLLQLNPTHSLRKRGLYPIHQSHSGLLSAPLKSCYFQVYFFFGHLFMSTTLAVVCSLLFESPFIGLEKIIFGRPQRKPREAENGTRVT